MLFVVYGLSCVTTAKGHNQVAYGLWLLVAVNRYLFHKNVPLLPPVHQHTLPNRLAQYAGH